MFSLLSLTLTTKPKDLELKSFYRHLNNLPNVSYAIQQVKTLVDHHHNGCKATKSQYQEYDRVKQRHEQL